MTRGISRIAKTLPAIALTAGSLVTKQGQKALTNADVVNGASGPIGIRGPGDDPGRHT